MKRKKNLYKNICDYDNIRNIYFNVIRKNTKNKRKIEKFEMNLSSNLYYIYEKLNNKNYNFNKYNIFLIKDHKYRIIMSENIFDKIVNHLVSKYIICECILDSLIDSNVATRLNKGTKYGNYLIRKYLNNMICKNKNFYILKLDIKKYFYNIDHNVLMNKLIRKCNDIDSINIIKNILNTTNYEYINNKINNINNNGTNNICGYEKDKGLPIGNMSSQYLAIFYLNDLDHYIKEVLKIKYYVRYMDDMILIHEDREYLNKCFNIIKEKLINEYKLELNNKSNIFNIKNGFNFLGFRYKLINNKININLCSNTKKKILRNIKYYKKNNKDVSSLIKSYRAFIKQGKCLFKIQI